LAEADFELFFEPLDAFFCPFFEAFFGLLFEAFADDGFALLVFFVFFCLLGFPVELPLSAALLTERSSLVFLLDMSTDPEDFGGLDSLGGVFHYFKAGFSIDGHERFRQPVDLADMIRTCNTRRSEIKRKRPVLQPGRAGARIG
jgi:hypothetical protein